MSASFRDDLVYPSLSTCQMRVVGAGASSRPPVRLPRSVRDAAASSPIGTNGGDTLDDFRLERAVLERKEERTNERRMSGATNRALLEKATIAKMQAVTGADEAVCIATLRDHGYDMKESIEAYLEKM